MVNLIPVLIVFSIFIITAIKINTTSKSNSLDFGVAGRKIPKDVDYYRDIPCNNDLHRAYFIAYHYGILKNKINVLNGLRSSLLS